MAELVLDSQIRIWVFLPIVVITFLVGIIRHYITILIASEKKVSPQQVKDGQVMLRSRVLRENGRFIPFQGYSMRKNFFAHETTGYFKQEKREPVMQNPMTDPSMMKDMMLGNLINMLPMIAIGTWINWAFSGFLTTKVPFPLTLRFKPMLQRGIELSSLDASWVSSVSWYFLNVFGLRSMYTLILGQDNAADQTRMMQDQMTGGPMGQQQDMGKVFTAEWEALQIHEHHWAIEHAEEELIGSFTRTITNVPNQIKKNQ